MATVDNEDYLACRIFSRTGKELNIDGYTLVMLASHFLSRLMGIWSNTNSDM